MKSIIRVVHLPSVVQSEFYNDENTFVCKENKINNFLLSVSPRQRSAILEIIHCTQAESSASAGNPWSNPLIR